MRRFLQDENQCYSMGSTEQEHLLYDHDIAQEGWPLVITTGASEIQAFTKGLLHKSTKVQVYSAHNHRSPYGRQTYEGD